MNEDDFRRFALSLAGSEERAHMAHPDFRVAGKIFATLPRAGVGMVKLTPDEQDVFTQAHPNAFTSVKGAWGRRGATYVDLGAVRAPAMRDALRAAWTNAGGKKG
ncbi:MAG TPA: MmcQ/YjbR family DNA-binding protein [Thermoanaerobaculia bacterium]|nr:MmcQ/YjbR family DNA-binding protein [Thermoanaerobaculia bacterium]